VLSRSDGFDGEALSGGPLGVYHGWGLLEVALDASFDARFEFHRLWIHLGEPRELVGFSTGQAFTDGRLDFLSGGLVEYSVSDVADDLVEAVECFEAFSLAFEFLLGSFAIWTTTFVSIGSFAVPYVFLLTQRATLRSLSTAAWPCTCS
jgi:hypothetical protein